MPKSTPIRYDPETGLFWRSGRVAGTPSKNGYLVLRDRGRLVYAHRLAWFITHGYWPLRIDHINGARTDNRIANLRDATARTNAENRALRMLPGAHFHRTSGLWKSAICVDGRNVHLGYYPNAEHASDAYLLVKSMVHTGWRNYHGKVE